MEDGFSHDIRTARTFYGSLLALQYESSEGMRAYQSALLQRLLRHAYETVPYYRRRFVGLFDDAGAMRPNRWESVPFLTKALIRVEGQYLISTALPENHGVARVIGSGGSTGEPVRLRITELENLARVTATYRMFEWYGLDCSLPLAMIRKKQVFASDGKSIPSRKWGFPWLPNEKLGDRLFLDVSTPVDRQIAWLAEQPTLYVNTLPSNILSLCFEADRIGFRPHIKAIISVAEKLTADIRDAAREVLRCRLIDVLSSAEGGVIAIECPHSGMFHFQSELVHVEVVKESGESCRSGEVGEIVVTSLYNYALPIIRYRSGDYVELGGHCPCGRKLPTIARFVGRKEHLFCYPDGSIAMPDLDRLAISRVVGSLDWRLVQTQADTGEFRYAAESLSDKQQAAIRTMLGSALRQGFSIALRGAVQIPAISSGKKYFVTDEWIK